MPMILQSSQLIWMEFGILLKLVGLIDFMSVLSYVMDIRRRQPYLCDFIKKNFITCLHLDIYGSVSFKLGVMIETTELSIMIAV